ncbi:hypothetical protein RvY_10170 [Ramazzottius varieornatus]|uniref:HIT domain-containing protein n=1 Tax=Ramazzottius varieornatus TaxID=947166 RepID=A0A1D1VBV9_RAMVA|nr:hypothetical protein RvY_10170 [Ramazzottius varieornatus]
MITHISKRLLGSSVLLVRALSSVVASSGTCANSILPYSNMADAAASNSEVKKAQYMKASDAPSIFTRIMNKEIPGKFLHEDDQCVALQDVNPQAPVHFLVIPRTQLPGISYAKESDAAMLGHLLVVARKVAEEQGLSNGYRVVINEGKFGCQSVPHLHIHVLGKRQLSWPPG